MSRPRKAEDPDRWPVPCGRCGQHYQIATRWQDGNICVYCYQQAKRTRGTCACGHEGVLPGLIDGRPACRRCSGVRLNVDCRTCGAEDELYTGSSCWRCTLAATVNQLLTDPATGSVPSKLQPLATALMSMKRANSGLTWIRQEHVSRFLAGLAASPQVTHEAFDALPASRTHEYIRGLLVEHGVLPRRDLYQARYEAWARQATERVTDPVNADVIRRYVRWEHLRRMNQRTEVTQGTFLRSKQTVTVAIELLNWLADHDIVLADLEQEHLDAWQVTGPTTRLIADRFLRWAIKTRLVHPGLEIQRHRRGTSPRMSASEQQMAVQRVVHTDELSPRDRVAAILVLVFGQQIENVAALTWDDVTVTDDLVTVRLGVIEIALPDPLDRPWRTLVADPCNDQTAAHPISTWVFRGYSPGRHLEADRLRTRLAEVLSTRAARLGTLHELTKLAPVAILAEALGYSPSTLERHALDSATAYARYVAVIHGS
jgi:hypothetical protein